MSASVSAPMDLIRELRLRQWARGHYVPLENRSGAWHPIVLDEMRRRDEELMELGLFTPALRSTFVPLVPTTVSDLAVAS
jgi:hypothetical protein